MFDFDEIIDRNGTYSMKYGFIGKNYPLAPKDAIPMWIADMDFACPPAIIDEVCNAAKKNKILGYSHLVEDEYYKAVAGFMKRWHHWDIARGTIAFSNGIVPAIAALTRLLTKEDEKVIFQTPCYYHFDADVKKTGRERVYNPLRFVDGRYEIDFEDFEKKCSDEKVTLFILCSPHNPTGRVWSEEELFKLAKICFNNGVKIVSDEIHFDLTRQWKKHIVLDSLFDKDKRIFTCTAPSKTFNMAGMQISNIIMNDCELVEKWNDGELSGIPNPLSIYALLAAYTKCDEWLDELKTYLDGNFALTEKFVRERLPKARFSVPEATYLAWIDLSAYGYGEKELMDRTQKQGALIQTASNFIDNADGHIRVNVALPRKELEKGLEKIELALK